ncbi:putative DNA-binding transcriptional regulator AlpA [Kitasatospora sp. GP30]|uniref:hypothetical protein n=1 Tax=Kitasatospora sp. GP30 TaxID=3035084 RepID=UPI000C704E99|nr:hypothetical protein [Kitasatospora sp. GP30]MDH6138531.1 putative DNA-binding transcriptional regulator AlpA [Kitasatospora sp. GP30]
MPPAPAPTLAERLAAAPTDILSVADIVSVTGLSEATVRRLTKLPDWPDAGTPGANGEQRFPRDACATWMKDNQAARIDVSELPGDDDDRVTMAEISNRTGIKRNSLSAYPSLYKNSRRPFPAADSLGTRRWGDVKVWLSERAGRSGPRGTVEPSAPVEAPAAVPVVEVLTTAAIEKLTGKGKEAVKSLVRRPEIAELSSGKVGRARVWPAEALLPALWELGYLPKSGPLNDDQRAVLVDLGYLPATGKPTAEQNARLRECGYDPNGTVEHRVWLAGPLRSVTELAAYYKVTVSAITHRLGRAEDAADPDRPVPPPIDTEDGKRYDPKVFDTFWNRPATTRSK